MELNPVSKEFKERECLKWEFIISPQNPVSKEFKENIKREILNKLYKFIPELANENQTAKQMIEDYIEKHILQPFNYGYLEIEITKATISYLRIEAYPIENLNKDYLLTKYNLQGMGFFVLPTLWSEECKKSNETTKVQESYSQLLKIFKNLYKKF
jgi:6-pyruvoyl-tetrahydropterin synthase